jgi:RNA polymerase sigma-70 factor (ECF subfamily)
MTAEFLDIYEEHVWSVYGFLAYRLRSPADAEDLTQVTFERALRAWDSFDERKGSVRTWLLAIARNALIDHGRREGSRTRAGLAWKVRLADAPAEPGPEERLGPSPELASALEGLRERERSVLALRFGADLPTPEIADFLDLSVANVQQILSRALRKLRRQLEGRALVSERTGAADPKRGDRQQEEPGPEVGGDG